MRRIVTLIMAVWATVACGGRQSDLRLPGVVDGDVIAVKALAAGTVRRILVQEGQTVRRQEVLAEMDLDKIRNAVEELNLAEAELANSEARARQKLAFLSANLAYQKKQEQRLSRLRQSEAVSGDQVERARLQLLEAQTALDDLEKNLAGFRIQRDKLSNRRESLRLAERDLIFSSPAAAVVTEVLATAGESVLPGAMVMELLDSGSLYVEVFVEERELSSLRLGQPAQIIPDGGDGRGYAGLIASFGQKAEFSPKYILSEKERQSLLYRVKVRIEEGRETLKLGMPVTVAFKR